MVAAVKSVKRKKWKVLDLFVSEGDVIRMKGMKGDYVGRHAVECIGVVELVVKEPVVTALWSNDWSLTASVLQLTQVRFVWKSVRRVEGEEAKRWRLLHEV